MFERCTRAVTGAHAGDNAYDQPGLFSTIIYSIKQEHMGKLFACQDKDEKFPIFMWSNSHEEQEKHVKTTKPTKCSDTKHITGFV